MAAVKNCRIQLAEAGRDGLDSSDTNKQLAEAMLLRAGSDYAAHASRFSADDRRVADHFHLQKLESTEYWEHLTDEQQSLTDRVGELVSLYSRLMFASSHLPRLASFINESVSGAARLSDAGSFALELTDLAIADASEEARSGESYESAADPDRIARVIDAANMIYQGVALLAGGSLQSLQLKSIFGQPNRTLVFAGQQESATAVRRIIRHLSEMAGNHADALVNDAARVENLVAQLPFLSSLDELERIGAYSGERISEIRSNVTAGAIMLVEAGAGLSEQEIPDSENLSDDAALSGAEDVVEAEVEAHYLDQFQAVREQMVGGGEASAEMEPVESPNVSASGSAYTSTSTSTSTAKTSTTPQSQHNGTSAAADDSSDSLDDLILDLNRLYKR